MQTTSAHESVVVPTTSVAGRVWVQAIGVVAFALLTAAGAMVAIPVPGTPVPMTLQTLFVLLAGMTLGPRLGTASMAFYVLLGMTGYHVFAAASWGANTVLGPTGGYLLGFILAQPAIGWVARRGHARPIALLAAAVAGSAVIFAAGLVWLGLWLRTDLTATLAMGLVPFAPGLVVKVLVAAAGGRLLQPLAGRHFRHAR